MITVLSCALFGLIIVYLAAAVYRAARKERSTRARYSLYQLSDLGSDCGDLPPHTTRKPR